MNLKTSITLHQLVEQFQLELIEDNYKKPITGINEIHKVSVGDLTFVDTPKYYDKVLSSPASFIIINKRIEPIDGKCILYSDNPFLIYNEIANTISKEQFEDDTVIDASAIIYPHTYIGKNVKIGKNTIIYPNVTIYDNVTIGDHVIIHANSVIGKDAFYYNKQQGQYLKMHTIGRVIIEDNVEIGSNCSIDSGVSGDTIIGSGTKMDNQIHIAHGVVIGKNCLLCAQVAIAGKSIIGNHVTLYGKVGISKGIKIGDRAVVLASSNVDKTLEGDKRYYGSPALEARMAMKQMATLRMLPDFLNKLKNEIVG
jgi:UDP-3-O-[3-hydroxymyristoyl] glucosamine N-acyltransferase